MTKFYTEGAIKGVFRGNLDNDIYQKVVNLLKQTPKSDVIPVSFMLDYIKKHDPVCENNIVTMINNYRKGGNSYE